MAARRNRWPHQDIYNLAVLTTGAEPEMRIVFDFRAPDNDFQATPSPNSSLLAACWEDDELLIYDADVRLGSKRFLINVDTGEITDGGGDDTKLAKAGPSGNSAASSGKSSTRCARAAL